MSRSGYDEYKDASALIYNQIRGGEDFMAAWLEMPDGKKGNQVDERKRALVELILKKMIKVR
jgi:hypothetical protein